MDVFELSQSISWDLCPKCDKTVVCLFLQFYPDRNHGIYGGGATNHLYTLIVSFLEKSLKLKSS